MLITFWVAMALVCVAAVVVGIVREIDPPAPDCPPPKQCSGPPLDNPASRVRTWVSRERGVGFRYPVKVFAVDDKSDTSIRLHVRDTQADGVDATLWISARPTSDGLPEELVKERRDDLSSSLLGLTEDDDPNTIVTDPQIGGFNAAGGSFRATVDSPQGPSAPAIALITAATRERATVVVSYVITGTDDAKVIQRLRTLLSPILISVTWKA
jgi:hypothetical protein